MKKTARVLMAALLTITMTTGGFPAAALAKETDATTEASAQQETAANDEGTARKPSADNVPKNAAEAKQFTGANDAAEQPTGAGDVAKKSEPGTASPESTTAEPAAQSSENAIAPTAIASTYTHTETAEQNGVTLTLGWNDASAGEPTTFHLSAMGGSGAYKFRMDAPFYMNPGEGYFGEMVADTSRGQWMTWTSSDTGCDYEFTMTASGRYYYRFYLQDAQSSIWSLRAAAETEISDPAHPSVDQIIANAVAQCRQETSGSEYDMALWLHDWTLNQLEYDYNLNWCSAESGLTRHKGTCESYQRIYAKLLDAAGIANGRITGNGHTWNAVKIDGKWCQMDLTWDDTNDNWYGDLDQRHLYFGLTDELMAIAHSDHTANYQKDGYAYRSTDLSNNYFVRNGKADEWAAKYADRIQQHLNAKEAEFSIDADNSTFPPSISGIQNALVAYAMNQQGWSTADGDVTLTATSNVTTVSNYEWSAKFDFEAEYKSNDNEAVLPDGRYYLSSVLDPEARLLVNDSSAELKRAVSVYDFSYELESGYYRITKGPYALTADGDRITLSEPSDSQNQLWNLEESGPNWVVRNVGTDTVIDDKWMQTSEGSPIWLYEYNGSPAQAWSIAPLSASSDRVIADGSYRLISPLASSMGVSLSGTSFALSSTPASLKFTYEDNSDLYSVSTASGFLTADDGEICLAGSCNSTKSLWSITKSNGTLTLCNAATGAAVDDKWLDTEEGAVIWMFEQNGSIAQQWIAIEDNGFIRQPIPDGTYIFSSALQLNMYIKCGANGPYLSSLPSMLELSFDKASDAYYIATEGGYLTAEADSLHLAVKNGAANQLWLMVESGDCWMIKSLSDGRCLDDKWMETSEGSTIWLYESNGSPAQAWRFSRI